MIKSEELNPLVSIVIPVKNGMPFLKDCLESIQLQNISSIEIIVSDDHSTDGSREFLERISLDNFQLISPPHQMTIAEHWTFVSERATGKYIKLLCSDDSILPHGLMKQIEVLNENPHVDLVASKRRVVSGRNITLIKSIGGGKLSGLVRGGTALRKSFLSGTNIFGEPSAILFRREKFGKYLPWNDERPYLLDFELYARMLSDIDSSIFFLKSTDATFRVHQASLSRKVYSQQTHDFKDLVKKYEGKMNLTKSDLFLLLLKARIKSRLKYLVFKVSNIIDNLKSNKR